MRIILRLEKGSLNQKPLQKDIHRDEFLLILQIPQQLISCQGIFHLSLMPS